jgi:hypothetical protein
MSQNARPPDEYDARTSSWTDWLKDRLQGLSAKAQGELRRAEQAEDAAKKWHKSYQATLAIMANVAELVRISREAGGCAGCGLKFATTNELLEHASDDYLCTAKPAPLDEDGREDDALEG